MHDINYASLYKLHYKTLELAWDCIKLYSLYILAFNFIVL